MNDKTKSSIKENSGKFQNKLLKDIRSECLCVPRSPSLPLVTNTKFLLTISIPCQTDKYREIKINIK